jgi:HD-GYP domain-containing protein (c-di-GMP phosphodiesterase class II)
MIELCAVSMATELQYNKNEVISAVRRNIRVLNSIVILIVFILLLVNTKYLSSLLGYIPVHSVVTLLVVVSGLVAGVFYMVKMISDTAVHKLIEYGDKIDLLLGAKQQEITERKIAEVNLKKAHDELEHRVEERTVELSKTIDTLEEQVTERQRAEEIIQLQLSRLNVLHSIETAINSSLDLHFTLEHLINQVITQLNVDASTILLLNNDTQVLEYVVSKGFRSNALKYTRLKMGESNAGLSARERRIVSIPDLTQEPEGFEQSKLFNEENFISYFAVTLVAKGQLLGVLELFHRNFLGSDSEWLEFLKTIASQAANAIDNAVLFDRLQKSNLNLTLAYDTTIEGWSHAMDMRDSETEGHSRRVTEVTVRIAQKFGIADEELVHIRRGALLHDLGKIGIPDSILLKPGKLTDEEWKIMKHHPEYAYALLHKIDYLKPALDIPYFHHEKWDGTGYPKGLKGMEIPLAARIFAVVDVWDALRADRPYRSAWPKEKVLEHIRSDAGTHFDPTVVETFLKLSEIDE